MNQPLPETERQQLGSAVIWLEGSIVRIESTGGQFDLADSQRISDFLSKAGQQGDITVLLDMQRTSASPDGDAVQLLVSSFDNYAHRLAIVVSSLVSRTILRFQINLNQPRIPYGVFLNTEKALAWLSSPRKRLTQQEVTFEGNEAIYKFLLETLSAYSKFNFHHRVPTSGNNDAWDSVAVAVNMLGDELARSAAARTEVESERNRFRNLFDGLDKVAIVSFTDVRGLIVEANEKFCEISGYSREELIGRSHHIVNSGYHPKSFFADLWKTIAAKNPWRSEICNRAKNGTLYWVDSTIIPLLDNSGNISNYFSIRYDITSRKVAEAALIQSEKMALLGEMAGGIAHEINNPVAVIEGSAEHILKLLKKDSVDLVRVETFAKSIVETSERIVSIVNGLRNLSRNADADPFSEVAVDELVADLLALSHERLERHGVKLDIDVTPGLKLFGNKTQLSQVLTNLVMNSDDAICDLTERWIRVEARATTSRIELSVTDSGKGIPESLQKKLFLPFFTTKAPGKGTGLGLSLSRKILVQHRGELLLDSRSPHTRFVLHLPLLTNFG